MKTNVLRYAVIACMIITLVSCKKTAEQHFLTDETYRTQVHEQFLKRKTLASGRSEALFSVMDKQDLNLQQREALEFLFAYMPLCDLADYDGDFFLRQVNAAFAARDFFPWGKSVPEDIFRHFVLVHRVNNEHLDTSRTAFFEELKDRVKNLSMAEAALEVNHWCHEKVTYRGTDGRTSAPLALIKTSWGRCGEESTFTAAALRAVGIPARQCYTPRWAHTDDNHAWVEAWIDGKWHYLGACEPEPELDMAWFTAPAKRTMMVHTNVFGLYNGPEEKNLQTELYSKINLLSNYADTRKVAVKITDEQNNPVEGATVQFKLYNYAEFYTIAESKSKSDGTASIISGNGDLMIWANKGDVYGYAKSSPGEKELIIKLDRRPGSVYEETVEVVPPAEQKINDVSPEKRAENSKRLAQEDSIRNAYMNTFMSENAALDLANSTGLDAKEVWKYIQLSQGNWKEISDFISTQSKNPDLFSFLSVLAEKDLRDTPASFLNDQLNNAHTNGLKEGTPQSLVAANILSPRIGLELIQPWRGFFQSSFDKKTSSESQQNVQMIVDYVKKNIIINDDENYYNCYISPRGVYELKVSDRRSRDVFFVALCRSNGIAARVEQSTGKVQYFDKNQWVDVVFDQQTAKPIMLKATLTLNNAKTNLVKPEYYSHYTIAQFKDGDFVTLDFENDPALKTFPCKLNLDPGYYKLMIGSRANDGSVTVSNSYFELTENQSKTMEINMPEVEGKIQILGIIDMNTKVTLADNNEISLKELSKGKGLILCFADPGKEPTKHILQDLPTQQAALDEWGGGVLFLIPDDKKSSAFDAGVFKNLPKLTTWGTDNQRKFLHTVSSTLQLNFRDNFPLTVLLSSNGGILYMSEGYHIGIGENLVKTIKLEAKSKQKQ